MLVTKIRPNIKKFAVSCIAKKPPHQFFILFFKNKKLREYCNFQT